MIKQNFVLGHAEISHENAAWKKENARVGDEQASLGIKTDELIAQFIQKGLPANIVDLLQQSRALMRNSAEKIRVTKNMDALPVQGKSLGLITEIEKYFIKMAAKEGSTKGPKQVKDPFEKPKEFEMKQRFDTVAGGLEALAQAQFKLAQELAKADPKDPNAGNPTPEPPGVEPKKPDPNRIEGTFTERQTLIAQRVGALLNQPVLPPEVNTHLEGAQGHARESLRQLDADDIAQAREPAAAAARELRLAAQTMDRLGEDDANDKLADALNRLNKATDEARAAADAKSDAVAHQADDDAAAQAAEARDKLVNAAQQQQEAGSAEAAARLSEAVHTLDEPKLHDALKQWHDQPGNDALAKAAADQLARAAEQVADQRGGKGSPEEIGRLIERVERTRLNFERLATTSPGTSPDLTSPDGAKPTGQPSNDPASLTNRTNGEHSPGSQSDNGTSGPPKGDAGQTSGQSNESSQGATPPGKKGQGAAGQGKENGKNLSEKGDEGAAKDKNGQGHGPNQEDKGQGDEGQGKSLSAKGHGQGQEKAQGGAGEPSSGSITAGQSSVQPTTQTSAADGPGPGNGSGHDLATDFSPDDGNADVTSTDDLSAGDDDKNFNSSSGHGGSPGGTNASGQRPRTEQQAQELMADLRDETLEARVVLVTPDAKEILDELHPDIHSPRPRGNLSYAAAFERIRAPLDRLITLLQAELEQSQRKHELTDQTQEKAPLAYGEAVADYFEQLSQDYQPSATPASSPPAGAATSSP